LRRGGPEEEKAQAFSGRIEYLLENGGKKKEKVFNDITSRRFG